MQLFLKEKEKFPQIYPNKFDFIRFNDSMFLSTSVAQHIIPDLGSIDIGGYQFKNLSKETSKGQPTDTAKEYSEKYGDEGREVAKFVGLVARIHEFIKNQEKKKGYPGPRTVISTGLRRKFFPEDNNRAKEDFFSANFSLSNAFIVNEKGSEIGIVGNKIFVEDNVARIISYNEKYIYPLVLSKFLVDSRYYDPFEEYHTLEAVKLDIAISKPIRVDLFGKTYTFRELNPSVLSNLQMVPVIEKWLDNNKLIKRNSIGAIIIRSIKKGIPLLEQIDESKGIANQIPLFWSWLKFGTDPNELLK